MNEEDRTAQEEELESLRSIYFEDELQISKCENGKWRVLVMVAVELPDNYQVGYVASLNNPALCYVTVKHLPPINVKINFDYRYPSEKPPSLFLSCPWLTAKDIKTLEGKLRTLWRQSVGFPIVYTWVEYLKQETLTAMGMTEQLNLTELSQRDLLRLEPQPRPGSSNGRPGKSQKRPTSKIQKNKVTRPVIETIEAYNVKKEKEDFLKGLHQCEICFVEKLGKDTIQFDACRHVFCRECLKGYFTVLVNEGSSCAVKCPAYKCDTEATQTQVREVLPPELFDKYDRALLSTMLDTMNDIVYCPRPMCQYPVTREPEECMAMCPHCRYAFCIFCRMVYHGVEPCKFSAEERRNLVEKYQTATGAEKQELEARYGKKQLETVVNNTLSECWVQDNSKRCPKCNIVIEKSDGCNKMTCFRCQTYFCWLCGDQLDPKSPYIHFLDPKSPCHKKLFLFVDEEAVEWEWENWHGEDSGSEDLEGEDSDSDIEL